MIKNAEDFNALNPLFRAMEDALKPYVDGEHYFDLLADDVVFDFIITKSRYITGTNLVVDCGATVLAN